MTNAIKVMRIVLANVLCLTLAHLLSGCEPHPGVIVGKSSLTNSSLGVEYAISYDSGVEVEGSRAAVSVFRDETQLATLHGYGLIGWVPSWHAYALKRRGNILAWDPRVGAPRPVCSLEEVDTVSGWTLKNGFSAAISGDGSTMVVSYRGEWGPFFVIDLQQKSVRDQFRLEELGLSERGSVIGWDMVLNHDGTQLAVCLPTPDPDAVCDSSGVIEGDTFVIDLASKKAERIARGVYPVGFLEGGRLLCMKHYPRLGRLRQTVMIYTTSGEVVAQRWDVIDASTDGKHIITVEVGRSASEEGIRVLFWTSDLKRPQSVFDLFADMPARRVSHMTLAGTQ